MIAKEKHASRVQNRNGSNDEIPADHQQNAPKSLDADSNVVPIRAKVPTGVAICTCCGRQLSTDGETVTCRACRRTETVDLDDCLRNGWPKCCGNTMTIDHPSTWNVRREGGSEK